MEPVIFSGAAAALHMRFEKAWHTSAQGMGLWDSRAFVLYDTGVCAVYDLASKREVPLEVFKLGSCNDGTPSKDYRNHANDCMFSKTHLRGNPIPLLYVTIGAGIGADADGYFYCCAVENILYDGAHYRSETVQTISFVPEGIENTPYKSPCWGCPAWLMDPDAGFLYIFSAKYRTKRGCVPEGAQNEYIITKFPLPDPAQGGFVRLTGADILDQFCVASDVQFTQGGTIHNGMLCYTFGLPQKDYPDTLMIFDLHEKCLHGIVTDLDDALDREEIECCAVLDGKLYVNTNGGFGIYLLGDADMFFKR